MAANENARIIRCLIAAGVLIIAFGGILAVLGIQQMSQEYISVAEGVFLSAILWFVLIGAIMIRSLKEEKEEGSAES